MADTSIEWTDLVWNPTTGCDQISPGCDNCYALKMAKRLKAMGQAKYQTDGDPRTSGPGFGLAMHEDALRLPLGWRKPQRIFVNSMSDLFHAKVPPTFIARVFAVMVAAPHHTFQVLTKRPRRMSGLLNTREFWTSVSDELGRLWKAPRPEPLMISPEWIWLGTSVEDQKNANQRIPDLYATPAAVRFLSCEPLLGPVDLTRIAYTKGGGTHLDVVNGRHGIPGIWGGSAKRIDWVITGGESGPNHRPADPDWFRTIRDQCAAAGVAYLHKQNGGRTPKANGRELDGVTHDGYPLEVAHA